MEEMLEKKDASNMKLKEGLKEYQPEESYYWAMKADRYNEEEDIYYCTDEEGLFHLPFQEGGDLKKWIEGENTHTVRNTRSNCIKKK